MNTDDAGVRSPRTYGNFRLPKTVGIGLFSQGQTLTLIALGMIAFTAFSFSGWKAGFTLIALGVVYAGVIGLKDKHGLSVWDKGVQAMAYHFRRASGKTRFRTGASSGKPCVSLPGQLSGTSVSEHVDAYERPFALIDHKDGTMSVTMALSPSGVGLLDVSTVDSQVAYLGLWLAELGGEQGLHSASITVETAPDTGSRLKREVAAHTSPTAPQLARDVLDDIVSDYKTGTTQVRTYATLTFDVRRLAGRRRDLDAVVREIASRLPGLTQTLTATGAGSIHLLNSQELYRLVRIAFDPASEIIFEQAATTGEQVEISWTDCGAVSANDLWDTYQHDSGISKTWVMTAPPRGIVQSSVLAPILAASRDVERKRVTIVYRPMDAARTASVVEHDLTNARGRVQISHNPSERALADLRSAQQVASEEAGGAGIVDFTVFVTATVTNPDAVEDTSSAIQALASSSRLQMRLAYGSQQSAFITCLPLGVTPRENTGTRSW